jgi:hypothetical protein
VNAIRMIHPEASSASSSSISGRSAQHAIMMPAGMAAVIELPAFERFAFVMSVLEGYSDRECSLLLDCSAADLIAARTRALQQIGSPAEFHRKLAGIDSDPNAAPEESNAAFGASISPLAVTA